MNFVDMSLFKKLIEFFISSIFCQFNSDKIKLIFKDTDGLCYNITYYNLIDIIFEGVDFNKQLLQMKPSKTLKTLKTDLVEEQENNN